MKYKTFFCSFLFIISCNQPGADQESESAPELAEDNYFVDFPLAPFLNLSFDELMSESESKVRGYNFTQNKENIAEWVSKDKKTQVVFSEGLKLNDFKVYFFNKNDRFLNKTLDLLQKNAKNDSKKNNSANYWYFEFNTAKVDYTITLFCFEDLIRLHYKPKQLH